MKKSNMLYNIYKFISEEEFLRDKETLKKLTEKVIKLLKNDGFYINDHPKDYNDLVINLNTEKDNFLGNISLGVNDKPNLTYDLAILKAYDIDGFRKSKKAKILSDIPLQEINDNYQKYFLKALEQYNLIQREDIVESTELNNRPENGQKGLKPLDFDNLPFVED